MNDDANDVTEPAIRAAIRARRAALGVTNSQIAESAGIPVRTLNQYVLGDSKLYIGPLIQIAGALDTTVEALIREAMELTQSGRVPSESGPGNG